MRLFLIPLFFVFLNAFYAKNILDKEIYEKYKNVIESSLDENSSLKETLIFLKNNGLINLYFEKIKTINPTFVFINNNPIFNTKTLYDSLKELGYYNFYPIKIKKDTNYSITLDLISQNYIDPLDLLKSLNKRGCNIFDIKKENSFTYFIECNNEKIVKTATLKNKIQILHNINGIYWINPNNFNFIQISTSKYDFWHPYIVFYDINLNILNIISTSNLIRHKRVRIPENCKYIKITDSFTKENIKRGIFIKGLK